MFSGGGVGVGGDLCAFPAVWLVVGEGSSSSSLIINDKLDGLKDVFLQTKTLRSLQRNIPVKTTSPSPFF